MHARLGRVYLALNNLDQAEAYFTEVLNMRQLFGGEEIPYAKFGLACVAWKRGEKEVTRQRAVEVRVYLSGSHGLQKEIDKLLADLEDSPSALKKGSY